MRGRGRPGGGGGEGGRLAALLPFSAWLFSPSLPGSSPHPSRLLVLGGRRGRGRPPWGNLPWGGRAGRQPLPHGDPPAGDSCRWQCSWKRRDRGKGGRGRSGGAAVSGLVCPKLHAVGYRIGRGASVDIREHQRKTPKPIIRLFCASRHAPVRSLGVDLDVCAWALGGRTAS